MKKEWADQVRASLVLKNININIYTCIIYTSSLRSKIAVSGWQKEQGRFKEIIERALGEHKVTPVAVYGSEPILAPWTLKEHRGSPIWLHFALSVRGSYIVISNDCSWASSVNTLIPWCQHGIPGFLMAMWPLRIKVTSELPQIQRFHGKRNILN